MILVFVLAILAATVAIPFGGTSAATAQARKSLKGWELYSWKDDKKGWQYVVVVGTNRLKTEKEINKYARHRELFAWLISPGLALVLLEVLLRHTILRRLP